jgi:hypothetical protein
MFTKLKGCKMERNDFLKLCQKVSLLPDGVMHTKRNVPKELLVNYNGHTYYPIKLTIDFVDGECRNVAVLHELKANCTINCLLSLVTLTNQE